MKKFFQKNNQQGYVLASALMILLLLLAIASLVFLVTTKDLRIAGRITGEKKAFSAVEAGYSQLKLFSNQNGGDIVGYTLPSTQVDPGGDPDTRYTITAYTGPAMSIPTSRDMVGYSIAGGTQYKMLVTAKTITGENTRYQSRMDVDVAVGYGPVDVSASYR